MKNIDKHLIHVTTETALIVVRADRKIAALKLIKTVYDCTLIEARVILESILAASFIVGSKP